MANSWLYSRGFKLGEELLRLQVVERSEFPASRVPGEDLESIASLLNGSVNCSADRSSDGEMRSDLRGEPTPTGKMSRMRSKSYRTT